MPTGGAFHIFEDCLHKAMSAGEKVLTYYDDDLLWLDNSSEKNYIYSTKKALETLNTDSAYSKNLSAILNRFHQNFEKVSDRQWLCPGAKFDGTLDKNSYLFMGPESHLRKGTEVLDFAVMGARSTFGPGFIESAVVSPNVHINELVALRSSLVV